MTEQKKYLTRPQAAEYVGTRGLPCQKTTLSKLACIGGGPEFRKFGSRTVYEAEALDRWIEARLSAPRASTSTTPAPPPRKKTNQAAK